MLMPLDAHHESQDNGRQVIEATDEDRTERWSMVLPPELDQLAVARSFVDRVADAAGCEPRTRFQLKLAVNEAVVNAMQHGSDFREPVRLTAALCGDGVRFSVSDPGPPFPMPEDAPPDLHDRGRGLMIIVKCVDDLSQHPLPEGKEVRLTKRFR